MKLNLTDLLKKIIIPQDKANHFIYGQAIFAVGQIVFGSVTGLIICAVVAGAKEIVYDKVMKKGTCSFMDFVATVAGGLAGSALAI